MRTSTERFMNYPLELLLRNVRSSERRFRPLCLKSGEMKLFHNLGWYREFFVPAYIAGAFLFYERISYDPLFCDTFLSQARVVPRFLRPCIIICRGVFLSNHFRIILRC
ncbi:hypothetical protein E0M27_11800 [Bacillus mycoides]|uniref:Uncharacterized protein n=1 Tax=Bacillus mycoides TaxID=1405 RepID=A0A4Q9YDJ5_BACMY|nr:hypothetical protein EXW51_20955 [Bacillus mycoides]TBX57071.1 hypothetical protein E0M27_11800 [Bacillus mycoides]TKI52480.1 hypothetical protein FC700_01075 [Bacillus mycoides]VXB31272.1 conserved hypothetical protein [Bacillus mycoides]